MADLVWDDDAHVTRPELRSLDGLARIWTRLDATQQILSIGSQCFLGGTPVVGRLPDGVSSGEHPAARFFGAVARQSAAKIENSRGRAAADHLRRYIQYRWNQWRGVGAEKHIVWGFLYWLSAGLSGIRSQPVSGLLCPALGLFALGLMSKTAIATLPASLLVVFGGNGGKLSLRRDVLPSIPFFVTGITAGLFTAWVEWKFGRAAGSKYDFSFVERFLIAGRAIWFYLSKLFWPVNLIFIYPRWQVSQWVWWQYLFPALAALLLGALGWLQRWRRGPLAALLFFVITLFPALGFFNVYPFRDSFVADHFQYLAGIGPIVLLALGH